MFVTNPSRTLHITRNDYFIVIDDFNIHKLTFNTFVKNIFVSLLET